MEDYETQERLEILDGETLTQGIEMPPKFRKEGIL